VSDVVLVGLPGSGKTTAGRALAELTGRSFVDTDDAFVEHEGVSVQEFLRHHGEADFRERETRTLSRVLPVTDVVATGGGVVTSDAARRLLREQVTVWLDCPDEVLIERVADGDRPLLGDDPAGRLAQLRRERDALYREVSRRRVESDQPLERLVAQLRDIVDAAPARP
jgi:shikimate kinase